MLLLSLCSPHYNLGPKTLTSARLNRVTGISFEVARVPRVFVDYAQISIPCGPVHFFNPGEKTTNPVSILRITKQLQDEFISHAVTSPASDLTPEIRLK